MPRHALPGLPSFRKTEVYEPLELAKERSRYLAAVRFGPVGASHALRLRGRLGSLVRRYSDTIPNLTPSARRWNGSGYAPPTPQQNGTN